MKMTKTNLLTSVIPFAIWGILISSTLAVGQPKTLTLKVDMGTQVAQDVKLFGDIKPLSWESGMTMKDDDKDGVYELTLDFNTKKRYLRFRFAKGSEIELQGSDARTIWFQEEPVSKTYTYNEFEFFSQEKISSLRFSEDEIKEDVAVLKRIIQYVHPAIYQYRDSVQLQKDFEQLEREMLKDPSLTSAYRLVSGFATKIQCSHTFTNPWNQTSTIEKAIFYQPDKLPITFKRIGKRIFVDKNASENARVKKGLEIISIDGFSSDSILDTLSEYIASDGSNYEKRLERLVLNGEEKFALFDIFYPLVFGSKPNFELVLRDVMTGEEYKEQVNATSKTNRTKILKERYSELNTTLRDGWNFELVNEKVARLQIKSFSVHRNEFDWKQVIDDAFDQLNDKEIPNLVIDIRENEGGQGEVAEYILQRVIQKPFKAPAMESSVRYISIPNEFRDHINTWDNFPYDFDGKYDRQHNGSYYLKPKYTAAGKTYKPRKDGYKGKVFLLTDASNSSATHLMAAYAKQIEEITLVGQETGGNQLGTNGSFIFFLRLPHTRVELDIPVVHMFVPPASGNAADGGIVPDIPVEKNVSDFVNGVDTEMQRILSLVEDQD